MNGMTRMVDAQTSTLDGLAEPWTVPGQRAETDRPAQRVLQPILNAAVLVADPGRDSREVLTQGLLASGISRVLVADSAAQVEDLVAKGQNGQLALVSLAFGQHAARLIDELRRGSWPRVIALAPTPDPDPVLLALRAGACGVLRGHPTPVMTDPAPGVDDLSDREIEVLTEVAEGRSNQWIGERMSLSALTIKSHLARISRKLGTGDRAQMVAIAMRAGLIA